MKSNWSMCSSAGTEGRTGIFHRKIAVSAEIMSRDWLRPWRPIRHSQFSVFKRWCSMQWTLGQFVFFKDFVCDWSRSFLLANKVLLHSALKTPGDFFDLWNLLDQLRKRKLMYDNTFLFIPHIPEMICNTTAGSKENLFITYCMTIIRLSFPCEVEMINQFLSSIPQSAAHTFL